MRSALNLAARAAGKASPNPMVGAVVVKKGKVIGEGYHHRAGQPHAEVEALKHLSAGQIRGATLYVTLEPCCHFGKTPPCAQFLIKQGLKRVVVAMKDPYHAVKGKGIKELRNAGIAVRVGLLKKEAEQLNEAFFYGLQAKKPFVILKIASSLDGKIALLNGQSKWITNESSRREVHRLRNRCDAILTTSATVIADNPHLGVRMVKGRDPLRIILDRKLKTAPDAQVYRDRNVVVVTTASKTRRAVFEKAGIQLLTYSAQKFTLTRILQDLYKLGVRSILVEAGAKLTTALLRQRLVQKGYFFIAPKIFGAGISLIDSLGIAEMSKVLKLKRVSHRAYGDDVLLTGYF